MLYDREINLKDACLVTFGGSESVTIGAGGGGATDNRGFVIGVVHAFDCKIVRPALRGYGIAVKYHGAVVVLCKHVKLAHLCTIPRGA